MAVPTPAPASLRWAEAISFGAVLFIVLDFFLGGLLSSPLALVAPSLTPLRRTILLAALLGAALAANALRRRGMPVLSPSDPRWLVPLAVVALVALAVWTRFATLAWDSRHGPDGYEALFLRPVFEMLRTGNLNHRYHEYPGLFLYLLAGAFVVGFMVAVAQRVGANFDAVPQLFFLQAGRGLVAGSSVLTVLLTFFLGRACGGAGVGLLAAALVCLSPLEIDTSQMIRPDIVLETLAVLALILMVHAVERGTMAAAGLAGAAVGAVTAVKYTGFLTIPPLMLATVAAGGPWDLRLRRCALALGAALATYALASPYSFLDLPGFIHGLAEQGRYNTDPSLRPSENMPLFYTGVLAERGLGVPALALVVLGLAFTLRAPRGKDWILLLYAAAYLTFFFHAPVQFDRFMLPCLPVLAVFAARGAQRLWQLGGASPRRRAAWVTGTVAVALFPLALKTGAYLRARLHPSPRDQVSAYVARHLPPRTRVAVSRLGPSLEGLDLVVGRFVAFRESTFPALRHFDFLISSVADRKTTLSAFQEVGVFRAVPGGPGHPQVLLKVPETLRPRYQPIDARDLRIHSEQAERLPNVLDGDPNTLWRARPSEAEAAAIEVDLGHVRPLGQIVLELPPEGSRSVGDLVVEAEAEDGTRSTLESFVLTEAGRHRILLPDVNARLLRLSLAAGSRKVLAIAELRVLERTAGA